MTATDLNKGRGHPIERLGVIESQPADERFRGRKADVGWNQVVGFAWQSRLVFLSGS